MIMSAAKEVAGIDRIVNAAIRAVLLIFADMGCSPG
jgi:hypothetical protein